MSTTGKSLLRVKAMGLLYRCEKAALQETLQRLQRHHPTIAILAIGGTQTQLMDRPDVVCTLRWSADQLWVSVHPGVEFSVDTDVDAETLSARILLQAAA